MLMMPTALLYAIIAMVSLSLQSLKILLHNVCMFIINECMSTSNAACVFEQVRKVRTNKEPVKQASRLRNAHIRASCESLSSEGRSRKRTDANIHRLSSKDHEISQNEYMPYTSTQKMLS